MASNPRIPESFEPNRRRPDAPVRTPHPRSGVPRVITALIVAAVLLAGIIYFMPRAPKATTPPPTAANVPPQPTPGTLQVSAVSMTVDPTGNSLYLEGKIQNTGNRTVNGAIMHVIFRAPNGTVVADDAAPVQALSPGQGTSHTTQALTQAPLKPGETEPFRVAADRVPKNWNHQMPELRISDVTSHP